MLGVDVGFPFLWKLAYSYGHALGGCHRKGAAYAEGHRKHSTLSQLSAYIASESPGPLIFYVTQDVRP